MPSTIYGATLAAESVLGISPAVTNYLMLTTVSPTSQGQLVSDISGSEITTGGYARQSMPGTYWTQVSATYPLQYSNNVSIIFGPFSGTFAQTAIIPYLCLVTTVSGSTGNVVFWWDLNDPTTYTPGQSLTLPADSLIFVSR